MLTKRIAPDFESLRSGQLSQVEVLKEKLKRGDFHRLSTNIFADILGPKSTSQRWEMATFIGLTDETRRRINWEGSGIDVASRVIDFAAQYGYPPVAEISDLVVRSSDQLGKSLGDKTTEDSVRTAIRTIFGD